MEHLSISGVEAALVRAEPRAWRALAALVPGLPVEAGEVRAELADGERGGPDRISQLAYRLVLLADDDVGFAEELRRWAVVPASLPALPAAAHTNSISGAAQLAGSALQARDVHGSIHLHAPAVVPSELPMPRQLPPPARPFVGRIHELQALDRALGADSGASGRLAVVSGAAGIGKTALVAYWAHVQAEAFPDGQLYVDLRGHSPEEAADSAEALGGFLRAFGVSPVPADRAEAAALWRSVASRRRILVFLDNAMTAAQIRPLLPASEGSLTVVTSRSRLTGLGVDGAEFHPLGVLDERSAAEILARRVGAGRVAAEPEAAHQVVLQCGGLPLALCVVAARVAARPRQRLAVTAQALDRDGGRLAALWADGESTVQSALDASLRSLAADSARLYGLLGLLEFTDFTVEDAAAVGDLGWDEADALLDTLAEVSLVEDLGSGRFRFHDLVRLHARERARAEADEQGRQQAVRRVCDWYLSTTSAAQRVISPSRGTMAREYAGPVAEPPFEAGDEAAALRWLDVDRQHLVVVLRTAEAAGWDALVWQLADAMWPLFLRLRPYGLWIETYRTGLAAARRLGSRVAISRMLTSGGTGLRNAGYQDEAIRWFGEALEMAREDADLREQAQALHGLGESHRLAGRLEPAEEFFQQALALRTEIGHERGAALTRVTLAVIAVARRRPEQAIGELVAALAVFITLGEHYEAARARAILGQAYGASGRFAEGSEQLDQAVRGFEEAGSAHWQARALEMYGELEEARDRPQEALRHYEESLARFQELAASDARRLADRISRLTGQDPGPSEGPSGGPSGG